MKKLQALQSESSTSFICKKHQSLQDQSWYLEQKIDFWSASGKPAVQVADHMTRAQAAEEENVKLSARLQTMLM